MPIAKSNSEFLRLRDCIVEMRFPGFTPEIADEFWRLEDEGRWKLVPREVATALLSKFALDVRDVFLNQDRSPIIQGENDSANIDLVWRWLQAVIKFMNEVEDVGRGNKSNSIRQALEAYKNPILKQEDQIRRLALEELTHCVDYEYWFRLQRWTVEEAVLLSMGLDPDSLGSSRKLLSTLSEASKKEFEKRTRLIQRNCRANKTVEPSRVIALVDDHSMDATEEFKARASKVSLPGLEDIEAGEKNSVYKMIAGMAIMSYELDPRYHASNENSKTPAYISYDLEDAKLKLDPKTIKKYLKKALNHVEDMGSDFAVKPKNARRFPADGSRGAKG